jgi:hypothetical protein
MDLVRDVLDKQMVDRKQDPMGRADGIVLLVEDGRRPRVLYIEAGATVLARRLNARLGRWVCRIARRWGLRRGRPTRLDWSKVQSTGIELKIDVDADPLPALAWEHWLREHIVGRLPGGKR